MAQKPKGPVFTPLSLVQEVYGAFEIVEALQLAAFSLLCIEAVGFHLSFKPVVGSLYLRAGMVPAVSNQGLGNSS